jgi:hypothetical protein
MRIWGNKGTTKRENMKTLGNARENLFLNKIKRVNTCATFGECDTFVG